MMSKTVLFLVTVILRGLLPSTFSISIDIIHVPNRGIRFNITINASYCPFMYIH